jgi:hypothetical protein
VLFVIETLITHDGLPVGGKYSSLGHFGETFEKCSFLFEFKEGDPAFSGINHMNTLSISRINI